MKPTQQEIIELAREAGFNDPVPSDGFMGLAYDKRDGSDTGGSLERLVHLALERFGAGGGEPVAWMYFDSDGDAIFGHPNGYRPDDAVPVYTHPSPTDLRADYERGLEDAKKEVGQFNVDGADAIIESIEALKGKQ